MQQSQTRWNLFLPFNGEFRLEFVRAPELSLCVCVCLCCLRKERHQLQQHKAYLTHTHTHRLALQTDIPEDTYENHTATTATKLSVDYNIKKN